MTAHPTEAAVGTMNDLMRAVLENPFDDLPRLVYADWLDEHGSPERSEFIRVQIELASRTSRSTFGKRKMIESLKKRERELWEADSSKPKWTLIDSSHADFTGWYEFLESELPMSHTPQIVVSRGFPSSVSLTLAALCGGEPRYTFDPSSGEDRVTGRTKGCAAALSRWPVTEIKIVGVEAVPLYQTNTRYRWLANEPDQRESHTVTRAWIGHELYRRLPGYPPGKDGVQPMWESRELAMDALSRAAVDYVRSLAEPPLAGMRWTEK